jgi:YesN/AraC family two-component response regulator
MLGNENCYAFGDGLMEVKHYIQENYHQNITLQEIAATAYISTYYLSHLFRIR